MTLALLPTVASPAPRRGRLPDREVRLRHIEVGTRILGSDQPVREIASRYRISRQTAYNWLAWALEYPDPEAEALRELHQSRG